jgi:hypothetical protein
MPLPDLAPEEYAEIVRLVRSAIDGERYVLSPRFKRLKSLLAKLDPEAERPTAIPYPLQTARRSAAPPGGPRTSIPAVASRQIGVSGVRPSNPSLEPLRAQAEAPAVGRRTRWSRPRNPQNARPHKPGNLAKLWKP